MPAVALCEEGVDRNLLLLCTKRSVFYVALCEEGVDRNLFLGVFHRCLAQSPSAKRAWIEILDYCERSEQGGDVALCEEGVDRNPPPRRAAARRCSVALCEEGVDRNPG